jgi:hypothetical protein
MPVLTEKMREQELLHPLETGQGFDMIRLREHIHRPGGTHAVASMQAIPPAFRL